MIPEPSGASVQGLWLGGLLQFFVLLAWYWLCRLRQDASMSSAGRGGAAESVCGPSFHGSPWRVSSSLKRWVRRGVTDRVTSRHRRPSGNTLRRSRA